MAAGYGSGSSVEDLVEAELRKLRANVAGVQGSLVATSDGLLVANDVPGQEPTQTAALVATTLAVASRATRATGRGHFREAIARGTDGYLAVYAAGQNAIVAVVGTNQLNVAMLQYQARTVIERIAGLSADAAAQPRFTEPAMAGADQPAETHQGRPMRRRAPAS